MKKMMFLSKNWYFSVQKALIYYTFNKSHHNSFILLVFSHVANFRYVANFRFLTLVNLNKDNLLETLITLINRFMAVDMAALTKPSISAPLKFFVSLDNSEISTSFASLLFDWIFAV